MEEAKDIHSRGAMTELEMRALTLRASRNDMFESRAEKRMNIDRKRKPAVKGVR